MKKRSYSTPPCAGMTEYGQKRRGLALGGGIVVFAAAGEANDEDGDFVEDVQGDGKHHLIEGVGGRCDDGGGNND